MECSIHIHPPELRKSWLWGGVQKAVHCPSKWPLPIALLVIGRSWEWIGTALWASLRSSFARRQPGPRAWMKETALSNYMYAIEHRSRSIASLMLLPTDEVKINNKAPFVGPMTLWDDPKWVDLEFGQGWQFWAERRLMHPSHYSLAR